jgi:methyl-accepting chemotaxis protein
MGNCAPDRRGAHPGGSGCRPAAIAIAILLGSVAEESSASAEQVSASTQQTSASTQEIAASAQSLAVTAEQLDTLVKRFKVTA